MSSSRDDVNRALMALRLELPGEIVDSVAGYVSAERGATRALLDEVVACLDLALRLPTWAIFSEEDSSAHHHGPKRAAEFDKKVRDATARIEALLSRLKREEASDG